MVSKILDGEIVIASHNKGKITEFSDLFKDYNLNLSSSSDYNIEEPEENGSSFAENALIKAKSTMFGSLRKLQYLMILVYVWTALMVNQEFILQDGLVEIKISRSQWKRLIKNYLK